MPQPRILIIEDDSETAFLLRSYLQSHGFQADCALTPADGLKAFLAAPPTLVILDVMLPGMNGFDVCRELRRNSDVPIVILTARGDVMDRIVGLEIGADDYVAKPFEPRELLARIQSVLRRFTRREAQGDVMRFDQLEIDVRLRKVVTSGRPVELSTGEFDALAFLARQPSEPISRERLIEELKSDGGEVFDRAIDTLISRVRTKLGDDPQKPRFIRTIRGVGYMFVAPPA